MNTAAHWTPHDPIWRQVAVAWREHGWRYVVGQARRRLFSGIWHDLALIELAMPVGPDRLIRCPPTPLTPQIRELVLPEQLPRLRPITSRGRYQDFRQFAREGFRCFVALIDEQVVAYHWFTDRPYRNRLTGLTFPVGPGQLYLAYSQTLRAWRGRGIDAALKATVLRQFQQEGYHAILTIVDDANRASLRAQMRWGAAPFREHRYARRLWQRRVAVQPLAPTPELLTRLVGQPPRSYNTARSGVGPVHGHASPREQVSEPASCASARSKGYPLEETLAHERNLMNYYAPHYRAITLFNSYVYVSDRRRFVAWCLQKLRAAGQDPARLSILEVGTSTGDVLELFAQAGYRRLTGLDVSEEMLAQARRHVPSARLIHDAIERHDFGTERFDVVVATFTLHHMHDPAAFFQQLEQVLVPRGWFFIQDFNLKGWTHAGWPKWVIQGLAKPFREALKWENRKVFRAMPRVPVLFNPVHQVLSKEEFFAAFPRRDAYDLQWQTDGLFLEAFNYALVEGSAFDRSVARLIGVVDRVVKPFGTGALHWIAGQRRMSESQDRANDA